MGFQAPSSHRQVYAEERGNEGSLRKPQNSVCKNKVGKSPTFSLVCRHQRQRRAGTSLTHHESVRKFRSWSSKLVCSGPGLSVDQTGLWIGQQMKATVSSGLARVPFRNTLLGTATNIQVQGMCLCGDLPWVGLTEKSGVHSRPGTKLCKSHVAVVVLSDSAGRGAKGGQDGRPSARRRLSLLH